MDYLGWIKAHERIVIVAMVLAVSAFSFSKWLDKSAMDAASKAAVAQQVAAVQHDADVKVAAAIAQQTALFNHDQALREQEMASLVAAVASRDAASNTKVKQVLAPKPITDVLSDLAYAYPGQVFGPEHITQDNKLAFALPEVQTFTATKIQLDTAQADLVDTKKELDVTKEGLAGSTSLVSSLQGQVTGLQTEITLNNTACTTQVAAIKAAAKKSKLGWFKVGVAVGFVAGIVTGHYIP
jgi:hypothetical protein